MKYFLIILIIATHIFVLFKKKTTKIPLKITKKIKLKLMSHKTSKKSTQNKTLLSKLGQLSTKLEHPIDSYQAGDGSETNALGEIYDRIERTTTYPSLLQKINQTGVIKANLYFNTKGEYVESKSSFDGTNFLKVSVARDLRRAFSSKLITMKYAKKHLLIKCFFKFRLSALSNTLDQSQVTTKYLYFYREGSNGTRTQDKWATAAKGVFNWLTLIKLLPDSKLTKVNMKHKLEQYKKDIAW